MSDRRKPAAPPGDDSQHDAAAGTDAGVLGNLPRTRPTVRSPRRQAEPTPAREAGPDAQDASAGGQRGRGGQPQAEPRPDEHGAAPDLEGLAKGGLAVAGGAASLGLRIAGRAAAAVRDAVERR